MKKQIKNVGLFGHIMKKIKDIKKWGYNFGEEKTKCSVLT